MPSTSSIQFNIPCGPRSIEQTESTRKCKIASIALGVILLLAGIVILSGAFSGFSPDWGWLCAGLGLVGLACGFYVHRPKDDGGSSFLTQSDYPIENPVTSSFPEGLQWGTDFSSLNAVSGAMNVPPQTFEIPQARRQPSPEFRQAEEYLERNELDSAFNEVRFIYGHTEETESFLARLAQAYYAEENKEKALEVIKQIYRNNEVKEAFLHQLAQTYFAEGNKEKALEVIKQIYHNNEVKEAFLHQLAQAYFAEGNKGKAFEVIKEICHNNEVKEAFLHQLAQAYFFAEGNKEKAFEVIKEISRNKEAKETFLHQLAQAYFDEGNKEKAFEVIKEIYHNKEAKEAFLHRLAQAYSDTGDIKQTVKVILEIRDETPIKKAFIASFVQTRFDNNDEDGIVEIIKEIIVSVVSLKALSKENHSKYISFMIHSYKIACEFYLNIAQECYQDIEHHLASRQSQSAAQIIMNKANDDKLVDDLLRRAPKST